MIALVLSLVFTGVVPRETHGMLQQHNCKFIDEFYDKDFSVMPPYVYGFGSANTKPELSVAVVCEDNKNIGSYKVIFGSRNSITEDFKPYTQCSSEFDLGEYYGGVRLSGIGVTSGAKKEIDSVNLPLSYKLEISYDGEGLEIFCQGGKWKVHYFH